MLPGAQSIEDRISNSLYKANKDKTFVDKVMGVAWAEKVTELIQKSPLNREDMNQLYSYLTSPEMKMLNLDIHNRYVILKYFVWIGEFIKLAQQFYDYEDYIKKNSNICVTCEKDFEHCKCHETQSGLIIRRFVNIYNNQIIMLNDHVEGLNLLKNIKIRHPKIQITKKFEQIFKSTRKLMEYNVKFVATLYLNIIRSSLSVNGVGFKDIVGNKFEVDYKNSNTTISSHVEKQGERRGIFRG